MDDASGWDRLLRELWTTQVRAAVVARIEAATVGRRGWLVRVFSAPEQVRGELTETIHALVLAAIRDETGADLDELGSQAAWECYEQVWDALAERWSAGGGLPTVPLGEEPAAVRRLLGLPPEAAVHAGADLVDDAVQPLWLAGRLHLDVEGLRAFLELDAGRVPRAVAADIAALLRLVDA